MPPVDPKRGQILDALKARLDTVITGATYHTTLQNKNFPWRPTSKVFEASEIPGTVLRDLPDGTPNEQLGGAKNKWDHLLRLEIDVVANDIVEHRKVVQDILAAIETDFTLGGLVFDLDYLGEGIEVDQKEKEYAGGKLTLTAKYRTDRMQI